MTAAMESLEGRTLLSLMVDDLPAAKAKGGGGPGGGGAKPSAPAIRLDLVALHEFGHSLGLGHSSDSSSIMFAYYNGSYIKGNFADDSAVDALLATYTTEAIDTNTTPWKDSLDPSPDDGVVDITYSFMLDGAFVDQGGRSNTFATFNKKFGDNWQSIFAAELDRWSDATGGLIDFHPVTETAVYSFNVSGEAQNDERFGDIRIGAHKFDGPSNVLAHAYFPPPNGTTAAGDAHFDSAENWVIDNTLVAAAPVATVTVSADNLFSETAIDAGQVLA